MRRWSRAASSPGRTPGRGRRAGRRGGRARSRRGGRGATRTRGVRHSSSASSAPAAARGARPARRTNTPSAPTVCASRRSSVRRAPTGPLGPTGQAVGPHRGGQAEPLLGGHQRQAGLRQLPPVAPLAPVAPVERLLPRRLAQPAVRTSARRSRQVTIQRPEQAGGVQPGAPAPGDAGPGPAARRGGKAAAPRRCTRSSSAPTRPARDALHALLRLHHRLGDLPALDQTVRDLRDWLRAALGDAGDAEDAGQDVGRRTERTGRPTPRRCACTSACAPTWSGAGRRTRRPDAPSDSAGRAPSAVARARRPPALQPVPDRAAGRRVAVARRCVSGGGLRPGFPPDAGRRHGRSSCGTEHHDA